MICFTHVSVFSPLQAAVASLEPRCVPIPHLSFVSFCLSWILVMVLLAREDRGIDDTAEFNV